MEFKPTTIAKVMYSVTVYLIFAANIQTQSVNATARTRPVHGTVDLVEDTCDNIHYLTLKERLLDNYDSFDEFYRIPRLASFSSVPKHSRIHDHLYVHNSSQECATLQVRVNNQGGVTCPGRFVLNRDINRVPCVIKEMNGLFGHFACNECGMMINTDKTETFPHQCLCTQCIIPHSLQSRRTGNSCKPIIDYVPVMRRTPGLDAEENTWSYVLEPLSLGCTCASRRHIFSSRT